MLDLLQEIFQTLFWTLVYLVEGIGLAFIPKRWRHKNVSGENVLITGAGSGMGRLLAYRFAMLKANLILWDINEKGNEETAEHCRRLGARATTYRSDVSDRQEVYALAEKVKKDVGNVDILVNNAGIVTGKRYLQCSDEMIQKTMDINATAHFWTVKAFLPGMMTRNHGHIVTLASAAGMVGTVGLADYSASKFAAVGFEESIRAELYECGKTGVHTTVVCPFHIDTGMFDGFKTRFKLMLPTTPPEEAVDMIMDAVLTNTFTLYIPKSLAFFFFLKAVLPVKCQLLLADFFGANKSMNEFRGRIKTD